MANEYNKREFGDSARNQFDVDFKQKLSNHVFDGAGENIQCHSDSESIGRKKKTRYINPAICIEAVESSHSVISLQTESSSYIGDITPHPHSTYRSNSTPFLSGRVSSESSTSVKRKTCKLQGNVYPYDGEVEDPTARNDHTYRDEGADTFRLSVTSVSTSTTAKEERARNERKKQEAFKQWLERKEQEKRQKARLEKLKQKVVAAPSADQREESYRRWMERKRAQDERRRADEILRRYQENERIERERNKKEMDKEEKLAEWNKKKQEDDKAMRVREERRVARAAVEEQRRRREGERAYRNWLCTSKNKPLPVPLNQGELSMRGSVSQMYINPTPWQST